MSKYNAQSESYIFFREFFITEDRLEYVRGSHTKDVEQFYKFEVLSQSGNKLHEFYSLNSDLF